MTDFSRDGLWTRILSGGYRPFPRGDTSVNILVPTRIEPEISDMIDQSAMPRSRLIISFIFHISALENNMLVHLYTCRY